jgi:hypothetical protein
MILLLKLWCCKVVTPCSLIGKYRFVETCCLYLQSLLRELTVALWNEVTSPGERERGGQEFWVHYCIYNSVSLVPILSQMNLVHTVILHFLKINYNIVLCFCVDLPNGPFRSGFCSQTLQTFCMSPIIMV